MTIERRSAEASTLLARIAARYAETALASSFGAEDMVLTDLIARAELPIAVFTLDTGRLPGETHALIDRTRNHYGIVVDVHVPDAAALEAYVRVNGVNAFYDTVELRQRCCAIRKTEPLRRALAGKSAWITGLRRAQSVTRQGVELEEFDAGTGLPKFNPLADWSEDEVWTYIRENEVPYNPLYDQGYRSIGCAPCSRPVVAGEEPRAGRWWWEVRAENECGIHFSPTGKIVRERAGT